MERQDGGARGRGTAVSFESLIWMRFQKDSQPVLPSIAAPGPAASTHTDDN